MRLSLLLVLALSLAGAELPISDPVVKPAPETFLRTYPVVAAGDGFLVAWSEFGRGFLTGPLMIRTFDADGRPRQPAAILVDPSGFAPHAVWTGSEYLLVFARFLGRPSVVEQPVIFAVRIKPNGTVLRESQTVVESTTQASANVDAIAWNGTQAIVAITSGRGRQLVTLDENGVVVDRMFIETIPVAIAATPSTIFQLHVPMGVAVAEHDGVFAAISEGGVVTFMDAAARVQAQFDVAPNGSQVRSIAWDGSAWVTAYIESHTESVCTARFTNADDIVRRCGHQVLPQQPAIAARDGATFTAWSMAGIQIVSDGGLVSAVIPAQSEVSAGLDADGGILAAWIENGEIRLGGFTRQGGRRPSRVVKTATPPRELKLVSPSLVVWVEQTEVYATSPVEGSPVVRLGRGHSIAGATNGLNSLVAWSEDGEIVTAFVVPNLNFSIERIGNGRFTQFDPSVAATPDGFVVVWNEAEQVPGFGIHAVVAARRFRDFGLPLTLPRLLHDRLGGEGTFERTTIGCGPVQCLVTWRESDGAVLMGLLVGHDALPRGVPRVLSQQPAGRDAILALDDGTFRVAAGSLLVSVAADGAPLDAQPWTDDVVTLGGVLLFHGRPAFVYERDRRVYLRVFAARARAVRH